MPSILKHFLGPVSDYVFPEAEDIFERNMHVLEDLGMKGWRALDVGAHSHGVVSEGAADGPVAIAAMEEQGKGA